MRKLDTEEMPPIGSISLGQRALPENRAADYAPFGANGYRVVPNEFEGSDRNTVVVAYYKFPE